MNHFCTYCDRGYAARLLCLYESMAQHGEPFVLHVLCFDRDTERAVKAGGPSGMAAVSMDELLDACPDYAAARTNRTPIEFFFTTTPVFIRYCLERNPEAATMTYLDSDLFFFGPASAVLAEQGDASVGIVPHRFPPHLREREQYGLYNVAWVSFLRDHDGLACLEWWRARCLEWCHDYPDSGRFADQGYLNEFPVRFGGVRILDHPGINAAPWNMGDVRLTVDDERVRVEGRDLLFYHFQGVREIVPGWFEPGLEGYGAKLNPALRELIYGPYLKRLAAVQRRLRDELGIESRFTYQRLNGGASCRARWERFKVLWVLPYYGRLRGRLIYCPEPCDEH